MTDIISPYRAIITRWKGPTNSRGSRIIADAGKACRITVSWDYALGIPENHQRAAQALREKMGWTHGGPLMTAGTESGDYVHILTLEVL